MNEKLVIGAVLGVVMFVGIAAMVQFNASTGAAVKYDYRDCVCKIQMKDSQGRIVSSAPIETRLRMHMMGQDCQNVCEHHYRGKNLAVVGIPGNLD